MSTEFAWDRNSLSKAFTVSGAPYVIDKAMLRKSISKRKNGKAAGPSDLLREW